MIPGGADPDLHARFAFGVGSQSKKFRMIRVGCQGEAGRSPGALTNSTRPESFQSRGDPADRDATEATAALGWGEMIADDFLYSRHAVTERLEILFDGAGQDLHECAAADFVRQLGRKTRQLGERAHFRLAMRTLDARVQD